MQTRESSTYPIPRPTTGRIESVRSRRNWLAIGITITGATV